MPVQALLRKPAARRTESEKKEIAAHHRSLAPLLSPTRDEIAKLQKEIEALNILSTMVQRENDSFERPSTMLRVRGNFSNPGEKIYAHVPAVLHPLRDDVAPNRLGLARWLVDKDNPLTARVTVNRFWEQYFGRGLVETSEDFGTQGSRPTHPELLDWLATELVARGWSLKAFHRLVVTSATYKQSSHVTPALLEKDPANRLYARGPRFRVEAEMLRDLSLTASGQLSRKMGGPPVFPVQAEGVWQVSRSRLNEWKTSEGEDRYRRTIYTFMRRSAPYPLLTTFDGTSREACTLRRARTNTPLQALTLLNDMAFFEAAQGLASRLMKQAVSGAAERATLGFRLCTARKPGNGDLKDALALYERAKEWYATHGGADKVLQGMKGVPAAATARSEWAAWVMVANSLLNLDATQTKE